MSDEQEKAMTLQEQLANLQKQNIIEGRAEIDAILERRGLILIGIPQFAQGAQGWQIVVQVGVANKAGET